MNYICTIFIIPIEGKKNYLKIFRDVINCYCM